MAWQDSLQTTRDEGRKGADPEPAEGFANSWNRDQTYLSPQDLWRVSNTTDNTHSTCVCDCSCELRTGSDVHSCQSGVVR